MFLSGTREGGPCSEDEIYVFVDIKENLYQGAAIESNVRSKGEIVGSCVRCV